MPLAPTPAAPAAVPLVWTRSRLDELCAANRLVIDAAARLIKAGARDALMPALQAWAPTHVRAAGAVCRATPGGRGDHPAGTRAASVPRRGLIQ